jgi:hypothetical protein
MREIFFQRVRGAATPPPRAPTSEARPQGVWASGREHAIHHVSALLIYFQQIVGENSDGPFEMDRFLGYFFDQKNKIPRKKTLSKPIYVICI